MKCPNKLTLRLSKSLRKDLGQTMKRLAEKRQVNRTFFAGYLNALENQGYVKLKKIGSAEVYFKWESVEGKLK